MVVNLVNDGGSKSRQHEQVARSGAECQRRDVVQGDCLNDPAPRSDSGAGAVLLASSSIRIIRHKAIPKLAKC